MSRRSCVSKKGLSEVCQRISGWMPEEMSGDDIDSSLHSIYVHFSWLCMSRKCLSLLSLVFVVVSLVRSFVFSGRWLRQIHLERVMSLSKSLSQNDVNELVLEYLATSGFSEAENSLRKELRGKTKPVAAAASTSRLEVRALIHHYKLWKTFKSTMASIRINVIITVISYF